MFDTLFGAAGFAVPLAALLIVIAVPIMIARAFARRLDQPENFAGYLKRARKGGVDLALIFEHMQWTAAAKWGFVLLVLANLGALVAYHGQRFVTHQAAVLLVWIGANILFGLMILLGRRRVLIVRRPPEK